jgi:hypothetical protein
LAGTGTLSEDPMRTRIAGPCEFGRLHLLSTLSVAQCAGPLTSFYAPVFLVSQLRV